MKSALKNKKNIYMLKMWLNGYVGFKWLYGHQGVARQRVLNMAGFFSASPEDHIHKNMISQTTHKIN